VEQPITARNIDKFSPRILKKSSDALHYGL
jgi:hypothetical protein